MTGWRYPPNSSVGPDGKAYATDGGEVRWLGGECAACIAGGQPDLFRIGGDGSADPRT